ncbi:PP-loop domain protein [Pyrolobus fumarii 1A]|uniref:PP-loop domain protein n=1 Tax=Pyrolobus fumarii (strain DSM 11204 / 1A) TaxID=694429 RepID=G0ECD7_PYRF1|nr:ATP-binding protein [Pyrolobus fumarii]AEM39507.1 PP-loop domain protein [Pyrolobus fumarii 1A]
MPPRLYKPRCARCGAPGEFTPSWAPNIALCRRHYIEAFRRRVRDALRKAKLKPRRVIVGVSGGKDSVALLDALAWVSRHEGFDVVGVTIDLHIPEYSRHALRVVVDVYNSVGVPYVIVDSREVLGVDTNCASEAYINNIVRRPTCALCGSIKRRILEEVAHALGADAIATGHTLDDLTAFTLVNMASGQEDEGFAVVEKGEQLMRLRPLLLVGERDTLNYVIARGLPFTETPCPFKPTRSLSSAMKAAAGSLRSRYPSIIGNLLRLAYYRVKPSAPQRCVYCGSPSQSMVCFTCRLTSTLLNTRICRR